MPFRAQMGEFLAKVSQSDVEGLPGVARNIAAQVAPEVIKHEVAGQGFAHVFPDGTGIEVGGALFEGAGRSCGADKALLMHVVFMGRLRASGRLHPGGVHAAHGWKKRMEEDIAHLIPEGTPFRASRAGCPSPEGRKKHESCPNYSEKAESLASNLPKNQEKPPEEAMNGPNSCAKPCLRPLTGD